MPIKQTKRIVVKVFVEAKINFRNSINGSNWQQTKMIEQVNSKIIDLPYR